MTHIDTLVPGYRAARRADPTLDAALQLIECSLGESRLPDAERARIGVAVAQHVGGGYAAWAMERLAAHAGLDGEQVLFARLGLAREPLPRALLGFARRLLTQAGPVDPGPFDAAQVAEIRAHVARAVMECALLQSISSCHPRASGTLRGVPRA